MSSKDTNCIIYNCDFYDKEEDCGEFASIPICRKCFEEMVK